MAAEPAEEEEGGGGDEGDARSPSEASSAATASWTPGVVAMHRSANERAWAVVSIPATTVALAWLRICSSFWSLPVLGSMRA